MQRRYVGRTDFSITRAHADKDSAILKSFLSLTPDRLDSKHDISVRRRVTFCLGEAHTGRAAKALNCD